MNADEKIEHVAKAIHGRATWDDAMAGNRPSTWESCDDLTRSYYRALAGAAIQASAQAECKHEQDQG